MNADGHAQTVTQKILSAHCRDAGLVRPGETIRIGVDWIMASELALGGMDKTFAALGRPPLHAPERFFLAIDHTVDPHTIVHDASTKRLVRLSRDFARAQNIAAFYDANETIMHTSFYRNHCVPGSVIVGADSHTTSHGALSAFAIGLGGADVAVAAVTGETWVTVPEEICVTFRGALPFGMTGKDIVLRALSVVGSNRLALEKTVEYRDEADSALSVDARFTICNMTAEMGGFSAIFPATDAVRAFYGARQTTSGFAPRYYTADAGAKYSRHIVIDLNDLTPQLALPFSPDNVVEVSGQIGTQLDGCFIGACTTTEEELVLSALVLEQLLDHGHVPVHSGKRLVIPGDRQIHARLATAGLLDIFRRAGFRVGVPGCHMCLGLGSERALPGERWLSSQNRNFKNRMGPGSIAWLASGATVAASALSMRVTDPRAALNGIDRDRLGRLLSSPRLVPDPVSGSAKKTCEDSDAKSYLPPPLSTPPVTSVHRPDGMRQARQLPGITGGCVRFGDNVDTDAIIPGDFCTSSDLSFLGRHAFYHVNPAFPATVAAGNSIILAGDGWGCGSSREHAAWALSGIGVQAVLARSFGSIHRRNLINMGIPALVVADPVLLEIADPGDQLHIDLLQQTVHHIRSGRAIAIEALPGVLEDILAQGGLIDAVRQRLAENMVS